MSEVFLSAQLHNPGTAPVPVGLTGHVADPPASLDRLGLGDLLQGRVVGRDEAGRMLVKTDLGVLKVATPQVLPEGTEVTLQIRQAGARVQVLILSAQLPPASAGAPPEGARAQADVLARTPLPDAVVRSQPIPAVLQSPASLAAPLLGLPPRIAPGSALTLRVLSVGATAAPPPVAATAPSASAPGPQATPVSGAQSFRTTALRGDPAPGPVPTQAPSEGQAAIGPRTPSNPGDARATPRASAAPRPSVPASGPGQATPSSGSGQVAPSSGSGQVAPSSGSAVEMARSLAAALDGAAGKATTVAAHPIRAGQTVPLGTHLPADRPAGPLAQTGSVASPSTITTGGDEPAPLRLTGHVIGTTGSGQPVLRTALGVMTLALPTSLPTGSSLALEILGLSPEAPSSGRPGVGGADGQGPAGFGVGDGQTIALGDLRLPIPETGLRLAPSILLFLAAIKGGRLSNWLAGPDRSDTWATAGADDGKPSTDVTAFMRRIDTAAGEWRLFLLPLLHAGLRSQVRLYLRTPGDDREASGLEPRDQATRFVIEAEISSLGGIQLDGLVAAGRFDLNFRSHVRMRPDLRRGIIDIYEAALRGEGWRGRINFARLDQGERWVDTSCGSREVLI